MEDVDADAQVHARSHLGRRNDYIGTVITNRQVVDGSTCTTGTIV